MSLTPFVVQILVIISVVKGDKVNNNQESEELHNVFFDCFTIFVRKGVGLPISMIFFLEQKTLKQSYCFNKSSTTQSQTLSPILHNLKSQHGTRIQEWLRN
jgi:hypothetical protein